MIRDSIGVISVCGDNVFCACRRQGTVIWCLPICFVCYTP
eukprot:XP_001705321.1 Hypothetical protein GL50803_35563 [Giardia lamblia ATCC 50803]